MGSFRSYHGPEDPRKNSVFKIVKCLLIIRTDWICRLPKCTRITILILNLDTTSNTLLEWSHTTFSYSVYFILLQYLVCLSVLFVYSITILNLYYE
jgi:hypothetical protein